MKCDRLKWKTDFLRSLFFIAYSAVYFTDGPRIHFNKLQQIQLAGRSWDVNITLIESNKNASFAGHSSERSCFVQYEELKVNMPARVG